MASISVTKPGYASSRRPASLGPVRRTVDPTLPQELKLYPDTLIVGTVLGPDNQPLTATQVTLQRVLNDQPGGRVVPIAAAQTDTRGGFRFSEAPGEYRLHLNYSGRAADLGDVMLPLDYPEGSAGGLATLRADSGQESRVELRPRVAHGYSVGLELERSGSGQVPRLIVIPSLGGRFSVIPQGGAGGESSIALPNGSYRLKALVQNRTEREEAETQVTVAGKAVTGIALRFAPVPISPVEVIFEPAATQSSAGAALQQVSVSQLNLRLQSADAESGDEMTQAPLVGGTQGVGQVQADAGRYWLRSVGSGSVFVRAATFGTTDLLTHPLLLGTSSGSEPIRVYVSNGMGQVDGTIRKDGVAVAGVVYFLAKQPSLTPVQMAQTSNGAYARSLAPGIYLVVALDEQVAGDLTSPEAQSKLGEMQTVQVSAGGATMVDLKLQTAEVLP